MVAPYEADAQLAFLSRMDIVDLVISEDSDTIVYGCKSVLFKLDKEGNGDLIKRSDLGTNEALSFAHWTDDLFKLFCCLAGCDYMPGIRNVGIKGAYKITAKCNTLTKVIEHLIASNATLDYDGFLITRLERTFNCTIH